MMSQIFFSFKIKYSGSYCHKNFEHIPGTFKKSAFYIKVKECLWYYENKVDLVNSMYFKIDLKKNNYLIQ